MNEELELCQPEQDTNSESAEKTDTTPASTEEITVPVKFNKEIKNLKVEEASVLAQKGMKFDMISDNYERIKSLAKSDGVSVSDYLSSLERIQKETRERSLTEECGGNTEIAKHIIELESKSEKTLDNGLSELLEKIPEITDISEVPESVIEASNTKGTRLLDEFLRYRLDLENEKKTLAASQKSTAKASVGSQTCTAANKNAASEFLRGLWG